MFNIKHSQETFNCTMNTISLHLHVTCGNKGMLTFWHFLCQMDGRRIINTSPLAITYNWMVMNGLECQKQAVLLCTDCTICLETLYSPWPFTLPSITGLSFQTNVRLSWCCSEHQLKRPKHSTLTLIKTFVHSDPPAGKQTCRPTAIY